MKSFECKKCHSDDFYIKEQGTAKGLYCSDCGCWQKWLGKDEHNAYQHLLETKEKVTRSNKESGWIINFKNGNRIILNEKAYLKYQKETLKEDVRLEEHWFILNQAIESNPDLDLIEL